MPAWITSLLRALDKISASGTSGLGVEMASGEYQAISEEARLRWATGDDFEVLASLGAGMFGSVWRVRDLTLQREVALKMLHPSVAKSDEAVARFRREAQMAARLQHPSIVPIYDWDSKAGVHWYIMELEEEGSVADLVRRSGPQPLEQIAEEVDGRFLVVFNIEATGLVQRLFPEPGANSRVSGALWDAQKFRVIEPFGAEAIVVVSSPKRLEALEKMNARFVNRAPSGEYKATETATQDAVELMRRSPLTCIGPSTITGS